MEDITLVIDPVAACLLGIFLIGVIILISLDWLRISLHSGKPRRYYTQFCHHCGEPWTGDHYCDGRKR